MSRIGKKPITIPAGVDVTINGQDIAAVGLIRDDKPLQRYSQKLA